MGALLHWHPLLRRGGLSWAQLRDLAKRIAARRDLDCSVQLREWPWRGSVSRAFGTVLIHVDSRQALREADAARLSVPPSPYSDHLRRRAAQVASLAHEVGHLALGHYALSESGVWFHRDGDPEVGIEGEADYFAWVATRSPGTPLPPGPQLRLL